MDSKNEIKIKIVSFNMSGAKNNPQRCIFDEFNDCNFLFFQETWLCDGQTQHLTDSLPNHNILTKSGFDTNLPLIGRPFGGLATGFNRNYEYEVLSIDSKRIFPVILKVNGYTLLTVNVYMPYDKHCTDSLVDFCSVLSEIETLIAENPNTPVLLAGDWNCDLSGNCERARSFLNFCEEFSLTKIDLSTKSEHVKSYQKTVLGTVRSSLIDWFIFSNDFGINCTSKGSFISSSDNVVSEHLPVRATITLPMNDPLQKIPINHIDLTEQRTDYIKVNSFSNEDWLYYQYNCDVELNNIILLLTS